MKKYVALYVLASALVLASCSENDSSKSTSLGKEKSNEKTEQTTQDVSGTTQYVSINEYIDSMVAQQFSFISFEKEVENNELITTVTFSVDNILSPKFTSTEQQFYWSVQLPTSLFEKVSDVPEPVMFVPISAEELTNSEREKSRYANFYRIQQRFEVSEEHVAEVEKLIQKKDSGYAFKLHDENYEEAFVFVDLESFVNID